MASPHASCSHVRHWRRGDLIGSGSFGKVNIAINTETCELFAVKSIECSNRAHAELLALENELHILQGLDSPWIVRCLGSDYTVENSVQMRNLFIEYMAGGSLADLMKKFGGRLEEPVIRVYTRYILQGLQYLHEQGVVHCDIKGKNILIASVGAKLADFGSAKRIVGHSTGNKPGDMVSMKGTPLWMAPEVVQQIEQGPASDIWSLGCTIVEMATGKPPWGNKSNPFFALYQIACTEDLPSFPDWLSLEGKDFLQQCFQRDPKARWTSSQLLEHPFVSKEYSFHRYMAPSSPTSILDFPEGSGDWETRSAELSSVPLLSLQKRSLRSEDDDVWNQQQENSISSRICIFQPSERKREDKRLAVTPSLPGPSETNWITVRSPNSFAKSRQRPLSDFMLQPPPPILTHPLAGGVAAEGENDERALLSVKKACDVNLDCIHFLRSRRSGEDEGRCVSVGSVAENCVLYR